jgi:hypothetical protein
MARRVNPTPDHYDFHGLLSMRVRRDRRTRADGYLDSTFAYYRTPEPRGEADIDVDVGPFEPDLEGTVRLDGRWWVAPGRVVFESRLKMAWWRTQIEGLEGGPLRVRIHANWPGRMVFPGETIYSLVRLRLAEKGLLLLHAPAVTHAGRALLLPARSGTGKTITAINFAQRGWGFMGDDSSIVTPDGAASFIVPFNLRFTYDVERLLGIRFSRRKRAEIFLKKCLGIATRGRITLFSRIYPWDIFGPQIVDRAPLGAVYILIQGPCPAVSEPQPPDLFTKSVLVNTLFEADELRAMLLAYCYVNTGSPLKDLWHDFERQMAARFARAVLRTVTVPPAYTPDVFEMIRAQAERDLGPEGDR